MNEAAQLLVEGAAIEELDRALVDFGFPVGPITLLDEVGIDVGAKVGEDHPRRVRRAHGAARGAATRWSTTGRLGRKNKKGFYTYDDGKKKARRRDASTTSSPAAGAASRFDRGRDRASACVLQMVNEAIRCLGEGILRSARDGDVGAVFGLGFPPFRGGPFRYADTLGAKELLDRIERLRARHGERFEPAPLLVEHAASGKTFHAR